MSHHRFDVLVTALQWMIKKNRVTAAGLEKLFNGLRSEVSRRHRAVARFSPLFEGEHVARPPNVHHLIAIADLSLSHCLEDIRGVSGKLLHHRIFANLRTEAETSAAHFEPDIKKTLRRTDHGGSQSAEENRAKRQAIERPGIIFPAWQMPANT